MRPRAVILVIASFFSDWGVFLPGNVQRPNISVPEIVAAIFIMVWLLQKIINPLIQKKSFEVLVLVTGILLSASLGVLLNLDYIDIVEHLRSCAKLLFWGVFIFCWVDIIRGNLIDDVFPRKMLKYYIDVAIIISAIAVFQYIFYYIFGEHIQLHPIRQGWGAIGGYYRATAIYGEPSWLGVVLIPPLFIQTQLLYAEGRLSYLAGFVIILAGIVVSLSAASLAIFGVWSFYILLRWAFVELPFFLRLEIKKTKMAFFFIVILIIALFILIYPIMVYRAKLELNNLISYSYVTEKQYLSSGALRFSAFTGFITVLKRSPLFGVGFDQENYITTLGNRYFEYAGSGIFGFIGTSAGVLGIVLTFLIFRFVWNVDDKAKVRVTKLEQPDLVIIGRTMTIALILEQLILYPGILNADFWFPLSFAYLFITSGHKGVCPEGRRN